MRTTVSIDDELLKQAKQRALERGTTLSDVVSEALRIAFSERPRGPRPKVRLITAGHGSRVMPGIDFSNNASVWAALTEYDRRQLAAGDSPDRD
jgi:hypothetical protein